MKLLVFIVIAFISTTSCVKVNDYLLSKNILLEGASFASDFNNHWFSYLCTDLKIRGYNKSISGTSIKNTAQRMYDGTLYTLEELDDIGIFMLMHVHNQDVCDGKDIKKSIDDYEFPSYNLSYSQAYDYVIRKYQIDCYNLKFNKNSKWYKSINGKPCIIVCLTHWHDARVCFNESIRLLQDIHKFYLCDIDKKIGFSKDDVCVDDVQPSLFYSIDSESINGVKYGWHMVNQEVDGNRCFIQNKLSQIVYLTIDSIYKNDYNYKRN